MKANYYMLARLAYASTRQSHMEKYRNFTEISVSNLSIYNYACNATAHLNK